MSLHADQLRDRQRLKEMLPTEEEVIMACISIAKSSTHLATFIGKISDFVEVSDEIKYRCALILNFCMSIWLYDDPEIKVTVAEYKTELSTQDIDDRFEMVFGFLFEHAKKKGWVK